MAKQVRPVRYDNGELRELNSNEIIDPIYLGSGGGGATTFIDLTDVPSSYTGKANKIVSVKADETGLEFITNTGGSSTNGYFPGGW